MFTEAFTVKLQGDGTHTGKQQTIHSLQKHEFNFTITTRAPFKEFLGLFLVKCFLNEIHFNSAGLRLSGSHWSTCLTVTSLTSTKSLHKYTV